MPKFISTLMFAGLAALFVTFVSEQDNKPVEPPKPVNSPSHEMLWAWNDIGRKLVAMAEDFPEDKYGFKAQKDQRTFGENLIHVAGDEYVMMSAIGGKTMEFGGNEDSLKKKYTTKSDIVKLMKQAVADGAELIKAQGDSGLTREIKYPWANVLIHAWFGWLGTLEHAGEHYGQLVVYYRVNGMIPPESRPKK